MWEHIDKTAKIAPGMIYRNPECKSKHCSCDKQAPNEVFESLDAAIQYLSRISLQPLPWDGFCHPCRIHEKDLLTNFLQHKCGEVNKQYKAQTTHIVLGCNVTGSVYCFPSPIPLMIWASRMAFGVGGTAKLWPNGVDPKTGRG